MSIKVNLTIIKYKRMIYTPQIFNIAVGFLALIPATTLILQYQRTRNFDFLLFSGVFYVAALGLFGTVLAANTKMLVFYQFQYIFLNLTFFLLFWYSYRVVSNIPRIILVIGFLWLISLIILIIFWQKIDHEDTAKVLFWEMQHSYSSYFPSGAGFKYNGSIIYSTGYRILGDVFRVYAFVINLYVYISVKPVVPKDELIRAKRLWIIASSFLLLYAILILPGLHKFPLIPNLLNLIGFVFISYIAIRIPEGLIISHAQMLRISELYDIAIEYEDEPSTEQYENLMGYMKDIEASIK